MFGEGQYKQLYILLGPYGVNKYSYSLEICAWGLEVMKILCNHLYWLAFASFFTGFLGRLFFSPLVGGAIGNISEMIIFGGATDFVYFSNTGTFLDHSIANLADMFIILPIIILVSVNTIKLFYYIVLLKLIGK